MTISTTAALGPGKAQAFAWRAVPTSAGSIGIRECGTGPETIVLLHGISSGAGSWETCAAHLAGRARIIAWDAPGYGQSQPLSQSAPLATDYATSLAALLDALSIKRCLLVGHSLGALMAAGYSSLPAAKAFAYLLFSPALGYGASERASVVRQGRLENLENKGIEGIAQALPARLLSSGASAEQRQAVSDNARRLNVAGYRQAVELLCGDDINRYTAIQPDNTRVYCGDKDIVTTPEQSQAYAEQHGLPFGLVANAGHACYIEQPKAVADLILKALDDFRGSHETC